MLILIIGLAYICNVVRQATAMLLTEMARSHLFASESVSILA